MREATQNYTTRYREIKNLSRRLELRRGDGLRETLSTNIHGKREREEQGRLRAVELTVCADNIQLDRLHSGVFTCARSHAHEQ